MTNRPRWLRESIAALPPEVLGKVVAMGRDPNQCREQAAECVRLANEGTTQQSRDEFIELAKAWLTVAAQLESDEVMLDTLDDAKKVMTPRAA
jgi:hypothetical protein